MAPNHTVATPTPTPAKPRQATGAQSSWGGLSSVLRLGASERRATGARAGWWSGMSRAMRAAGPSAHARPLHAVLASDFAPSGWLHSR